MPFKDPAKNMECRKNWEARNPNARREIGRRYRLRNKEKENERHRRVPKSKMREYWLNCEYGKGAAAHYKQRVEIQKGLCDACGGLMVETPRFDHNHKTGKFRGLLHDECNKTLGIMRENKKHLIALADYLDRWEREHNAGF